MVGAAGQLLCRESGSPSLTPAAATTSTSSSASSPTHATSPSRPPMLRLNVAIPPAANPNSLGLLGNDPAGFPNGRRVIDDIVTIELRALAGVTYALVDKSFTPDAAAGKVTQGVDTPPTGAPGTARFLPNFPYLGIPNDGFDTPPNPTPPPAPKTASSGTTSTTPLPLPLGQGG